MNLNVSRSQVGLAAFLALVSLGSSAHSQTADPAAVLTAAQQSRYTWESFPGFTASVVVLSGSDSKQVNIEVDSDSEWRVTDPGTAAGQSELPEWSDRKISSILSHRRYREPTPQNASYVEGSSEHIFGSAIAKEEGGGEFRIADNVLREVVRKSEDSWLEIDTAKILVTDDGRNLPEVSVVHYRDPKTGDLEKSRTNVYSWVKVGEFYLPLHVLEIELGNEGEKTTRSILFSDHKLRPRSQTVNATLTSTEVKNSVGVSPAKGESLAPAASTPGRLHRPLKESLTSFGAAVLGEYLYVFSGHDGEAHGFGRDLLSKHFRRIRFDDPNAEWEDLPMHEPAQSVALVTDGTYLYRIGGLSFLNEQGDEETNYNSTDHFSRFDVETKEWTELAPLPEARSSLDACVLGRHVYVAGGWNLQGSSSSDAPWAESMLRFDLENPEAGWESLPGPGYKTRAISLAAYDGRVFLFGGIQQRGISRKVSIYDPSNNQWSEGPELPADSSTAGFATSSFATGGKLYVTGGSGVVYRLSGDEQKWQIANRLFYPRMFLRLVPADSHRLLALGGTGSSGAGRMAVVESVNVAPSANRPHKMATWSVEFGGQAKHSQALVLDGSKLYAFGGNASRSPHDFSQEAFVDEAFVFDVTTQTVEPLPEMPIAMQSGAALVNRQTSEHRSIVVAGGLGFDEQFSSLDNVLTFNPETKTWSDSGSKLPEPRSMYSAVVHDDAIWSFGGASGTGSALLTNVTHWWGDDSGIVALPDVKLPTPRRSFGAAKIGSECYLVGGLAEGSEIAKQVDVFNFDDRSWRTAASPEKSRVFPSVVELSGKIYLHGGFSLGTGHFAEATSLEVYDPEEDAWQTVAEELPGVEPSMKMLAYSGRLLFYGIDRERDGVANFVLFDPDPLAAPSTVESMNFSGRGRGGDAELEGSARMLMRRDTDKDGKLSNEELGSRLGELLTNESDQDQDQLLDFEELLAKLKADQESDAEKGNSDQEDSKVDNADGDGKTNAANSHTTAQRLADLAKQAQAAADAAKEAAETVQEIATEAAKISQEAGANSSGQ